MAALATLMLCLGISVSGWVVDRGGNYSNNFTVNIPAGTEGLQKKLEQMTDMLEQTPGIISVRRLSDDELRDMLAPWLGNKEAVGALPLPGVIEVATSGNTDIDIDTLQSMATTIAAGTEIDTHERWIESFSQFSAALRALTASLTVVIITGLALVISFMSRAALKLHARTVSLLHSIGAEDNYITRQFQNEAFMLTLRGTMPASLIAGLSYWVAGWYISSLHSSMLPALSMNGSHILLLLFMPLACSAIAWLAARVSVIKQLQRIL